MLYFLSRKGSSFYNLWATRFDPVRGAPVGAPFQVSHFDSSREARTEIGISDHRAVLTMRTVTGSIWMLDAR